jgi:hypothetical protein
MSIRQGPVSMVWWCHQHNSTPLSTIVLPPWRWGMTWWISQSPAGMRHPGMMQPPSRAVIARR